LLSASSVLFLDLISAPDTVVRIRQESYYGVSRWLRSYLSEISVFSSAACSESCAVSHGLPQGSVLGPLLFTLDDLQFYMPLVLQSGSDTDKLQACLSAVRSWLSTNFLLLNSAKTEMMVINPLNLQELVYLQSLSHFDGFWVLLVKIFVILFRFQGKSEEV
uniref:Uncharacterized protein n=1 Tax=Acanthochromis polyacanthus TaxID=80966 RepID=A0A3Q1EFM4_9TELE